MDVHGAVECHAPTWRRRPESLPPDHVHWWHVMDLATLEPERDHDVFGCLFGVPEAAGSRPVAAGRGFPEDAASRTRERYQAGPPDAPASWLTYTEVAGIDGARHDVIPTWSRWHGVFQMMGILARRRVDEAVRLVVWFG